MAELACSLSIELTGKLLYHVFTTVTQVNQAYQVSDSFIHGPKRSPSASIMGIRHNALHRNNCPNCVGLAYT